MKDDLERVLEGLGKVEAPAGLEGRVLRGLQARAEVRDFGFLWAWVGVAALLLVGVLSLRGTGEKTAGFTDTAPFHEVASMQHPEPAEISVEKSRAVAKQAAPQSVLSETRKRVSPSAPFEPGKPGEVAEGGFPAPAAPLSDQERLLLRLARRPNEATIAMFDEGIREERAAAEKAEFEMLNPQRPATTDEPQETKDEVPGKQR